MSETPATQCLIKLLLFIIHTYKYKDMSKKQLKKIKQTHNSF